MKDFLLSTQKYILYFVTGVQLVLATVWLVLRKPSIADVLIGIVSITAVTALVLFLSKRASNRAMIVAALIYFVTMPVVLDTAVSKGHIAGLPAAPEASIEELMVQRFVWPRFFEMTDFSEYDFASEGLALSVTASPELLYTDYFPLMRENLSSEALAHEYKERVSFAFSSYKKAMAKEMTSEFGAYFFSPVSLVKESFSYLETTNLYARNYETFSDNSPVLSKIYMRFGCISFLFLILLGMLTALVNKEVKVKKVVLSILCIGVITLYNLFFPVRGFDYKNTVIILMIYAPVIFRSMREHN